MKGILLVCVLTWVQAQVLADVWEFGIDSPDSDVVSHVTGQISILEKVTNVPFTVPPCYQVSYVRVEVENLLTTPSVHFDKLVNMVTITYKLLQFSQSSYDIVVKARRGFDCNQNRDITDVNVVPWVIGRRQYMPSGMKFPVRSTTTSRIH